MVKKDTDIKKNIFSNYRIGDFLIRIKNSTMASRSGLTMSSTKFISAFAKALKEEGYLKEVEEKDGLITIEFAVAHKKPVLSDLKLVSKPGLRIYQNVDELKKRKKEASILILSTSKGIMSHKKAIKESVGGEVIAEIW